MFNKIIMFFICLVFMVWIFGLYSLIEVSRRIDKEKTYRMEEMKKNVIKNVLLHKIDREGNDVYIVDKKRIDTIR